MVQAPEGCWGTGTTNKTKVPARMTIRRGEDVLYDSGDYQKDVSGLLLSIRGNTSAHTDQPPYKLKLQKKADLLLRGDKTYNDKQWLLLRDNDVRTLNAKVGFKVGELAGLQWTPIHIMWGFYFAHFFSSTNLSFMAAYKQKWDENVAVLCAPLETGLPVGIRKPSASSGRTFDLGGRRTNSVRHGIVIKDGRKTMR